MSSNEFIELGQSAKLTRVRIAIVQLECHPALAVGYEDWLSEPFVSKEGGPLRRLFEQKFPHADDLRKHCRKEYLDWSRHRLSGVCEWFKSRFTLNQMPDIFVFPECGVPLEHLPIVKSFAEETKAVIFAGTHSLPVDASRKLPHAAAALYQQLGIVNDQRETNQQATGRNSSTGSQCTAPNGVDADTQEELHRILRKNSQGGVPSLSVLPIITPNDPVQDRIVRLRVKTVLSPFERTEGSMGYKLERPRVVPITLTKRGYRGEERTEIKVLPLVCAEALHLVRIPAQEPYQLAVVVSLNENFDYFEPILELHKDQQIPIAYCNDGKYGNSTIWFPLDRRQADAFYGPSRKGLLPAGDSILVGDVTLGVNASVREVSYTQQFYNLVSLASVVQKDDRLPEYQVAKRLNRLRRAMKNVLPDASAEAPQGGGAPSLIATSTHDNSIVDLSVDTFGQQDQSQSSESVFEDSDKLSGADPFRAAELARKSLRMLEREYDPTELQGFNVFHLRELLAPPCNAYPSVWDIHAWDCVINAHPRHPSIELLQSDLATKVFTECSSWFERHELKPDQASVVAQIRKECQERMRQVLYRVLTQLERTKTDARSKAKERLFHQLGAIVERFGATSGWLLPVKYDTPKKLEPEHCATNDDPPAPILPGEDWWFGDPLTHNSTNRYRIDRPQAKVGIVGQVVATGLGYVCNHVVDAFEEPIDPYYKVCIPTTRSEIAVPIWEPPSPDDRRIGPRLIAVLNLESNQFGAFLPVIIGELQTAVATLVPDLIVYDAARDDEKIIGWHPAVHGWGSMHIVDRFCYAVASSAPEGREEPRLTCTIWNFDDVKGLLYARGTCGFDYEYLTQCTLDMESYSGKIVKKYLVPDSELVPGPRVYRIDVLSAAEQDSPDEKVNWYDFRRKQKVDRMGMSKLIVTPLLRHASEAKPLKVFGTLNLYFYRHDEAFVSGQDPAQFFTNAIVLRTAELAARLVKEFYMLRERVVPATLAGRLADQWQHGVAPFDIIKKALADCLEGDGVTLLSVCEDEKSQGPGFKAVATTGMEFQGLWINPRSLLHTIEEVAADKDAEKDDPFRGVTRFLLGKGGRTLRLINVADSEEPVSVTLNPSSDRPRRGDPNEERIIKRFQPVYRSCESLPPAEYWKHRYLGASFGSFGYKNFHVALGGLRVIRSANARPFVRHDELVLGYLAAQVAPMFQDWFTEVSNKPKKLTIWRRGEEQEFPKDFDHKWLPPLAKNESPDDGIAADPAIDKELGQDYQQAALDRLIYRSRGPVAWNRQSVNGLLQDLLFLFRSDGAILADIRFAVAGKDGEMMLRPYFVTARDSQQAPDERHSSDVSVRHMNNGWRAIFQGQPVIFEPDGFFTPTHQISSAKVKSGICWPFRTFAHGHCVDGVFSLDFKKPLSELRWQPIHAELLALVARLFAWMASGNSVNGTRLPTIQEEIGEPDILLNWFCNELEKLPQESNPFVEVNIHRVCLFAPNRAWKIDSSSKLKAVNHGKWPRPMSDHRELFLANRADRPDAEMIRYGVQFDHDEPRERWHGVWQKPRRFRFPLYLGAWQAGYVEGSVKFLNIPSDDHNLGSRHGKSQDLWRPWRQHFRILASRLDTIAALWCSIANGNAPLRRIHPFWEVYAGSLDPLDKPSRFSWKLTYRWPWFDFSAPEKRAQRASDSASNVQMPARSTKGPRGRKRSP